MKRSKHSLSHTTLTSFDMGQLVPVSCVEVLQGDSFNGYSSALIRVTPQAMPVMHPAVAQFWTYFVPMRLVWDGTEDFLTGGEDGIGGSSGAYPTINSGVGGFAAKGLMDYLGVKPGVINMDVSALPPRAFNLIYNEWFRDQDLVTKRVMSKASGVDTTTDLTIPKLAWGKDGFTTARPWSQKGPAISLPLGTSAPVTVGGTTPGGNWTPGKKGVFRESDNAQPSTLTVRGADAANPLSAPGEAAGNEYAAFLSGTANLSAATAANVIQLREAMALQRYEENRAMWGSRFPEWLAFYGIRSSDARLQRPELLSTGRNTLAFTEVLQTGPSADPIGIGDMYGHGIGAVRSRPYLRFFEEPGFVITLMAVRPVAIYGDALHKMWSRRIKEDYFTPELQFVGQQEVWRREVYAEAGADGVAGGGTLFGWQDRYWEYTEHPSGISAEMRTSTLNSMHMARMFGSAPALNASFVLCDATKRIYQEQSQNSLWVQARNVIRARRMVVANPRNRII